MKYAIFRDGANQCKKKTSKEQCKNETPKGGHQYKAEIGKYLYVDVRDIEPGTDIVFNEVLAVRQDDDVFKVGQPFVEGAKVVAEVLCKAKGPKLVIRWFKRRKNSRKKTGHRQTYIKVKIKDIIVD